MRRQLRATLAVLSAVAMGLLLVLGSLVTAAPAGAGDICNVIDICNTNTPVNPSVTVDLPSSFGEGGLPRPFQAHITSNDPAVTFHVTADFTINDPQGLDASQLDLEYQVAPNTFQRVPLTQVSPTQLSGQFGPSTGFDVPPGYNQTTNFRASFAPGTKLGAFSVDTILHDASAGAPPQTVPLSNDDHKNSTVAAPVIEVVTPSKLGVGAPPAPVTATLTNNTGSDYAAVRVDFALSGIAGLTPGQVTLEYQTGPSSYQAIPLTDAGGGNLTGYFGPTGGFPLPNGYAATTNLRVSLAPDAPTGTLHLATTLDNVDSSGNSTGTVATDTTPDDTAVSRPTLDVHVPTSLGRGAPPVTFQGTVSNQTGSSYPAVRFDFTLSGLKASQVTLQYEDAQNPGTYLPVPLTDQPNGSITGYYGPVAGFPLPDGASATTNFRVALAADAPTGTLTTTTTLDRITNGQLDGTLATDTDNTAVNAPVLTVNPPAKIGVGATPNTFTASVSNNTGADYPNVRFDFTLSGISGLKANQVHLEYETSPGSGTFQPVPLTDQPDGSITGYYGPQTGFPLPNGASNTTTFRVSLSPDAPTGTLHIDTNLDNVDANGTPTGTLATDHDTTVVSAPAITLALPAALGAGAPPKAFTGTLTNTTGSDYSAVRADFTLSGVTGLKAAQVDLEYETSPGSGTYQRIPLADEPNGTITGYFGPQNGFPLPNGYSATTKFTVAIAAGAPTGTLQTLVVLDDIGPSGTPTGTVSRSTPSSTTIGAPTVAVNVPASLIAGTSPTTFTGTVTNNSGSDYPAVRLDFTLSGISGLKAAQVDLEYETTPGSGTYQRIPLADQPGGSITGYFGPQNGFPLPNGYSATTSFKVSIADGAPTGTLTVVTALDTISGGNPSSTLASDTDSVAVTAPHLAVSGIANPVAVNTPTSVTVQVLDTKGQLVPGYMGTIHFTTTDAKGSVPADYTFTSADAGSHTFPGGVAFGTPGKQTVTATDVASSSVKGSQTVTVTPAPVAPATQGYWLVASDGGIFTFGDRQFYGSTGSIVLNKPIVGMATTPTHHGYWLVASDGGIFAFGDALFHGSTGSIVLNKPIVGMAATPSGAGYWLVASDGGIFSFGDATFYGSTGGIVLNKPIVGMAARPGGGGYWLVASDGGIFAFGDARFHGSTGSIVLNKPINGMASTPSGGGYWLVASDGGVFAFGDATFYGSTGSIVLNKPVVGMAPSPTGAGYWLVASDGGIFAFGDAIFQGSTGAIRLNKPVVGMAS